VGELDPNMDQANDVGDSHMMGIIVGIQE